jgi:3,4-dihydroxy 2-butanone 4-phosphate synthase/GTP cyclohydrolase II
MDPFESLLVETKHLLRSPQRPLITLSYAQSLDGCLTAERGRPTALSGAETRQLTHRLRAAHDAILVGIGTVLADNPQLNVRMAPGPDPQPIVLDSRLRFPLDAILLRGNCPPWIVTTPFANPEKRQALQAAGAHVLELPTGAQGHVHLPALLDALGNCGLRSVMVEGGARVITAFLESMLVDQVIITISPRYLGGLHVVERGHNRELDSKIPLPRLAQWDSLRLGDDLVIWGQPEPLV